MSEVVGKYNMTQIELSENHRFRGNPEMLKLDKNLRANAASNFKSVISEIDIAKLPAFWGKTQQKEAETVADKVNALMQEKNVKIALLFRKRSKNAEIVEAELTKRNIPYFYGMFTDEDENYIDFHNTCQEVFIKRFAKSKVINKRTMESFSNAVKSIYATSKDKTTRSLLKLLDAFMEKVAIDYADIKPEDKYTLLLDIFENRQLKQAMEYIDSQVILSTVHGAKGLEWEYVIVCDVEKWVFPFTCNDCPGKDVKSKFYCRLPENIPPEILGELLDDFCVFYVALTRAKRQAFISASAERYNSKGVCFRDGEICCFASASGIKLFNGGTLKN